MEKIVDQLSVLGFSIGKKILFALALYVIGKIIINKLSEWFKKSPGYKRMDPTFRSFLDHFVKTGLFVILIICIISVLGVPMASVITVLASAGVAIGMALQGALGNLAGGIMLMILRPFEVHDYIQASQVEGTVREIGLFYTVLITVDGCKVTVPNGALMNANIVDYTSESQRRMDMSFLVAQGADIEKVEKLLKEVVQQEKHILKNPQPFIQYMNDVNNGMNFVVRVWVKTDIYWDVYYDLNRKLMKTLRENQYEAPVQRITMENNHERR